MSEAPKLLLHKPKKAQKRQSQSQSQSQSLKGIEMQSSSAAASPAPASSSAAESYRVGGGGGGGGGGGATGVKPPDPPKESFARRYKFLWPLLLGVNIAVGAYLFVRTKRKDAVVEEEAPSSPIPTTTTPAPPPAVTQQPPVPPLPLPVPAAPVKLLEPVPEILQREVFKWVLEEKRKIKPKDSEEKKRLDEDKAILKQFIRAKSIPPL